MREKRQRNRVTKAVYEARSLYEQKDEDEYIESSSMAKGGRNMRRPCLF